MWTTETQEKYRSKLREFGESEILPHAARIDRENVFPDEMVSKLNDFGLLGLCVDKKYGGTYIDTMSYIIAVEEMSRVCGSTGITLAAHNSLGCWPIYEFGTEEQKQKYLPAITTGGELAGFGLTEPEADVDPTFYADVRGEAFWDMTILWTLPVAGILLVVNSTWWIYFGLVGGGMYLYFAGRGIAVRLVMQRRGIRIGKPETVKVVYVLLTLWGLIAVVTIIMAVAVLPLS